MCMEEFIGEKCFHLQLYTSLQSEHKNFLCELRDFIIIIIFLGHFHHSFQNAHKNADKNNKRVGYIGRQVLEFQVLEAGKTVK